MPIPSAPIQSTTGQSSNGTITLNLASIPSNNNTLILGVGGVFGLNVKSISQTGAIWQKVVAAGFGDAEIWYSPGVSSAGTEVIVTMNKPGSAIAVISEHSSLSLPTSLDQTASNYGYVFPPDSGTTGSTTHPNELFWSFLAYKPGSDNFFKNPTNGFTTINQTESNDNGIIGGAFYKIVTQSGIKGNMQATVTQNPDLAWSDSFGSQQSYYSRYITTEKTPNLSLINVLTPLLTPDNGYNLKAVYQNKLYIQYTVSSVSYISQIDITSSNVDFTSTGDEILWTDSGLSYILDIANTQILKYTTAGVQSWACTITPTGGALNGSYAIHAATRDSVNNTFIYGIYSECYLINDTTGGVNQHLTSSLAPVTPHTYASLQRSVGSITRYIPILSNGSTINTLTNNECMGGVSSLFIGASSQACGMSTVSVDTARVWTFNNSETNTVINIIKQVITYSGMTETNLGSPVAPSSRLASTVSNFVTYTVPSGSGHLAGSLSTPINTDSFNSLARQLYYTGIPGLSEICIQFGNYHGIYTVAQTFNPPIHLTYNTCPAGVPLNPCSSSVFLPGSLLVDGLYPNPSVAAINTEAIFNSDTLTPIPLTPATTGTTLIQPTQYGNIVEELGGGVSLYNSSGGQVWTIPGLVASEYQWSTQDFIVFISSNNLYIYNIKTGVDISYFAYNATPSTNISIIRSDGLFFTSFIEGGTPQINIYD